MTVPGLTRPPATSRWPLAAFARGLVAPAVVGLVLLLLLPMAVGSLFGAVVALGAAVLMIALVTFGIESTAIGLLALSSCWRP